MAQTTKKRKSSVSLSKIQVFWHRFVRGFKSAVTFVFSQIGLTGSVVAYSILGGWIFMGLEAPHERELRDEIASIRSHYVRLIMNATEMSSQNEDDLGNMTYHYIIEFEREIVKFIDDTGWNGQGDEKELQWSYTGALLYSVTVITTIGYGHIAPKTDWGRIVTIIYAMIGIPLTLLCLHNIGCFMAGIFKFIYYQICYRLYLQWQRLKRYITTQRDRLVRRLRQARLALEELIEKGDEMWRSTEILLTEGTKKEETEKDETSSNKELQRKEIARDRIGTRRLKFQRTRRNSKRLDSNSNEGNPATSNDEATQVASEDAIEKASDNEQEDLKASSQIQSVTDQEVLDNEISDSTPEVRVPISVSLLVIAAYIFLGAVLFSLWEKNWDYLISSYFCFVTLSTIGFGDFVPGSDVQSWSNSGKQAICTLYLLFGMAMIAMCFNLMQQEVILKFTDLGRRMGLIEEKQISALDEGCTE